MLTGIFVTGATGFVGSHFIYEWLRSQPGAVTALVRPRPGATGHDRLAAALETVRHSMNGAPAVTDALTAVEGDVVEPLCGVDGQTIARLKAVGIDSFWHFASDLRYEDRNRDLIERANIDGAINAFELARAVGAKRFVYISTAYVCGRTEGLIEETLLSLERDFSNSYEETKARAEHILIERCAGIDLPLTILRPSIVIGPRVTKLSGGGQTGLFSLLHSVLWIRSSRAAQSGDLRVAACPGAEINFIPVDCVVADMIALATGGFGAQRIYNLTAERSVSVAECWRAMSEVSGMDNVRLVPPESFAPSPAEQLIARRIGFFLSYINADRCFVRSLKPAWALDATEFADYVRVACGELSGA